MPKSILIFSPEALVVPHMACSLIIGRTLQELGHQVRVAYCHSLFQSCVSKNSVGLKPGTPRDDLSGTLCKTCSDLHTKMVSVYGLQPLDLRSHYPSILYDKVRDKILPFRNSLVDLEALNIRFGQIAFHDVSLIQKIPLTATLDEETTALLEETVASALALNLALSDLFRAVKFDMVIVNGQYAPNITALRTAAQFGIDGRILYNPAHMNVDRRWVEVCRTEGREIDFGLLDAWPLWKTLPLDADFMTEVKRDIITRSQGAGVHIYSPGRSVGPVDLRKKLELPADGRLLVAFTSSLDEQSAEHALFLGMERVPRPPIQELFADQAEWLSFLVAHARTRPDLYLVIRIHPREDSNKRDRRRSWHLQRLESLLTDLPSNVRVIWPRDPVSSYDLMELAEVVLHSWSTTGVECARLGIPTIGAFRGFHNMPVGDFISSATTREGYLRLIDEELRAEGDLDRILLAYRWYYVMRFAGSIWFGDVIQRHDQSDLPPFKMPSTALELERELFSGGPAIHNQRLQDRTARCASPAERTRLEREERDALLREMRDIVHYLMTGKPLDRPFHLSVRRAATLADAEPQREGQALLVLSDNGWCSYRFGAEPPIHRTSRVAARLAPLCAQQIVR